MSNEVFDKEVQDLIEQVDNAKTEKFSELAKIAGLNLAEDFVGVDLSGEDLSEDDLSGVNLKGANLRGTNLSHSNLSGANLSEANLSEAILDNTKLVQETDPRLKYKYRLRITQLQELLVVDESGYAELKQQVNWQLRR